MPLRLPAKRPSKYLAKSCVIDGVRFASQKEGRRYLDLRLREKAGEIVNLQFQPRFPIEVHRISNGELTVCGHYTADFAYYDVRAQRQIVEDVKAKATKTEAYRLRKRLIEAQYDFQISEV